MDYNSNRKKLLLPEYGRHIQKMVDYCVQIEDLEERTRCAQSIIIDMGNMFPHLRDVNDFKHKLWDHLAIMSDFKMNIETPFDLPEPETLNQKPEKIPYNNDKMKYKHYGITVEKMIKEAAKMEDGEAKDHLIMLLAYNMKKSLLMWNKDFPGDERVFQDIIKLSDGKLKIDTSTKINDTVNTSNKNNSPKQRQRKIFKRHDNRNSSSSRY